MALCSLVVFLAVAVAGVAAVVASVRCIDAARELARLAARGEEARGREVAATLAPAGASLSVVRTDDTLTSEVVARLAPPMPIRVGGRAVAAVEPGVP